MNWLLWKEYRENRPIVIAAAGFLLAPHLLALWACCVESYCGRGGAQMWIDNFSGSSQFSFFLSQLTIALFGGNAIAGERADRSAEFLAALPIARKRILASKLLLCAIVIGAVWAISAVAVFWLSQFSSIGPRPAVIVATPIVSAMFFGVAWLLSSYLNSPTYSVVGGLFTPGLLWAGFLLVYTLFSVEKGRLDEGHLRILALSYFGLCLALAPLCFAVGTWYYLRRVEP